MRMKYNFSPPCRLDGGSGTALRLTLIPSKLVYACVIWNDITSPGSTKLETIQMKSAALCYTRFFNGVYIFLSMKTSYI
jgi:hypothetical protein